MVKSDSPIFKDKVGKKNMFTAAAEFFCFFKKKKNLATKPLTKSKEREIFKSQQNPEIGIQASQNYPPKQCCCKKG